MLILNATELEEANQPFLCILVIWCILKDENTNGWRDNKMYQNIVKRNLYKSWFSQTTTLSIVHIF